MSTCPHCGARSEHENARYCGECGKPLKQPAPPQASQKITPTGELPLDSAQRVEPLPQTDSVQKEYVRAVQDKLADGVLDDEDREQLEDARALANLTVNEAETLESQAKNNLTSKPLNRREAVDAPLALELNDGHFYMAKYLGVLDFRLVNQTGEPIRGVDLIVSGKHLSVVVGERLTLSPKETVRQYVQIEPECAGEHLANITLSYRVAGEMHHWNAQALFMVLAKNDPIDKIQLNIDQSTKLSGDKIGFGQSIRKEVHEGVIKGLIRDANDLIGQVYPESWQRVSLRRRCGDGGQLHIIATLAYRGAALNRAALMFSVDNTERRVLVLGQSKLGLGRNRREDIVLRRLPRTEENDRLTIQIQTKEGPHLSIDLRDNGLYLVDHTTKSGTWLNRLPVKHETVISLTQPSEVDVARALRLRLTPYNDGDDQLDTAELDRYTTLGLPDETWKKSRRLGLRALLIERIDNLAREERYLIVYRWATLARELGDLSSALTQTQSRLICIGGKLWMECCAEDGRMTVNGHSVDLGGAFPLSTGLQMQCGHVELRVAEYRQHGL